MRILLTGANGLLGRAVCMRFSCEVATMAHHDLDVCDEQAVAQALLAHRPDWLINCSAATDVDRCENERKWAFNLNARAPRLLARVCEKQRTRLMHISTDYVFDGKKQQPYVESDQTQPLSVYGVSKRLGELEVLERGGTVVRTQWLYGASRPGFVHWVLRQARHEQGSSQALPLVADTAGCPTWVDDLAQALEMLAFSDASGVFHASGGGEANWLDFGREILSVKNIEKKISPIQSASLQRAAVRPQYSVLGSERALAIRDWREALAEFLARNEL